MARRTGVLKEWIDDITYHGGWNDTDLSFIALRTVLKQLRDHLPQDLSKELGERLPYVIQDLYFEGWDPKVITFPGQYHPHHFMKAIEDDLSYYTDVKGDLAIKAVFKTLGNQLSHREVEYLNQTLPGGVVSFWMLAV